MDPQCSVWAPALRKESMVRRFLSVPWFTYVTKPSLRLIVMVIFFLLSFGLSYLPKALGKGINKVTSQCKRHIRKFKFRGYSSQHCGHDPTTIRHNMPSTYCFHRLDAHYSQYTGVVGNVLIGVQFEQRS